MLCKESEVDLCEGNERPRLPSTSTHDSNVEKVNSLVKENKRSTTRELAEECRISVVSCFEMLAENFKMHPVAVKFVLNPMTDDQKAHRILDCQELCERSEEYEL